MIVSSEQVKLIASYLLTAHCSLYKDVRTY